jgi:hypothetical protein
MKIVILLSISFLLFSCKEEVVYNYQAEMDQLSTYVKQSEYLEKIYNLDQNIRIEGADLLQKTGEKRIEYKNNRDSMMKLDVINLAKIETYLAKYGYPSLKNHTEDAVLTPWLVIHHNPDKETSRKYFKTLYQAYKKGDLEGGAFTLYLGRFYSVFYNKRLDLESPYTEEFEVDTLVKALDLVQLRDEVDLAFGKK